MSVNTRPTWTHKGNARDAYRFLVINMSQGVEFEEKSCPPVVRSVLRYIAWERWDLGRDIVLFASVKEWAGWRADVTGRKFQQSLTLVQVFLFCLFMHWLMASKPLLCIKYWKSHWPSGYSRFSEIGMQPARS